MQKEEFEKAESETGPERMKKAVDWALLSGISNIKSIVTAARKHTGGIERGHRGADGGGIREPGRHHEQTGGIIRSVTNEDLESGRARFDGRRVVWADEEGDQE